MQPRPLNPAKRPLAGGPGARPAVARPRLTHAAPCPHAAPPDAGADTASLQDLPLPDGDLGLPLLGETLALLRSGAARASGGTRSSARGVPPALASPWLPPRPSRALFAAPHNPHTTWSAATARAGNSFGAERTRRHGPLWKTNILGGGWARRRHPHRHRGAVFHLLAQALLPHQTLPAAAFNPS
jgi:hypothetical protein